MHIEVTLLIATSILALVQVALYAVPSIVRHGLAWGIGNRDETVELSGERDRADGQRTRRLAYAGRRV